jgi:hypothetical protein
VGLDTLQLSVIDNYICVMIVLRLTREGYIWPLREFVFPLTRVTQERPFSARSAVS